MSIKLEDYSSDEEYLRDLFHFVAKSGGPEQAMEFLLALGADQDQVEEASESWRQLHE